MATIVAIAYEDPDTAARARTSVVALEEERVIQADQVAVVSRDLDGTLHVLSDADAEKLQATLRTASPVPAGSE